MMLNVNIVEFKKNSIIFQNLFRTKIDEQKAEIERLEGILDVKVESEKTHVGMCLK